jgi:trigger factor
MQTTVENTDKHTVKLTIEVSADQVDKDLDTTYRSIAREVKIPGFRPGKAPKPLIDAQVGRDVVLEEFVHQSVPSYFREAVTDEDLAPIGDPDVDVEQLEPGKAFIFTATVEVRPRLVFTKDRYEGVRVEKPSTEPTDEEVAAYIERLQRQFAELEPVDRPAQESDLVTVSQTVTRAGDQLDALTRDEYLYSIGSGEFGEAMDAKLAGTKPGDIVEFDEELPAERFGEEIAGSAHFRVLVKDVKALRLPEANDAFASTASEFDTLGELREDLREKLREVKERDAEGVVRDRALQAVVDTVEVDLPESLIADETAHRLHHAEQQAERYGITLDQMLELQGWDHDRLAEDSREHAIRAITSDLVLEAVARNEALEVTAEELGVQIGQMAQAYDREPKELAKQLDRSGQIVTLAGDIIRSKALDILVERADIIEESPEVEEVDASPASEEPAEEGTEEQS